LVPDALPPLHFNQSAPFSLTIKPDDELEYLASLDFSDVRIDSLVVLSSGWRSFRDMEEEGILSQIVGNVVEDVKVRAKVRRQIARDLGTKTADVDDWEVDEFIDEGVRWTAGDSQKRAFLPFLRAVNPRTIRLNPFRRDPFLSLGTVITQAPVRIVTYYHGSMQSWGVRSRFERTFPFASFETSEEEQSRLQREKEEQRKKEEEV